MRDNNTWSLPSMVNDWDEEVSPGASKPATHGRFKTSHAS
jgi:hypothetical protein